MEDSTNFKTLSDDTFDIKTMFSLLNQMMIVSGGIVVSKNAQEMDIVRPKD